MHGAGADHTARTLRVRAALMSPSSSRWRGNSASFLEGDCVGPLGQTLTGLACGPGFFLSGHMNDQSRVLRDSRNALAMTLNDDSAIASAATIGDSTMPNSGYSAPAASGTPAAL